jgi:hypothetical protein
VTPPASRETRAALRATEVFLACLGAGLAAYFLLGHRFLTAAYYGRSLSFINRLGDRTLTIGQYLSKADERVMLYAITGFVSFFFYLLLVLAVRRLLKSDADSLLDAQSHPKGVRASEVACAFLAYSLLTIAFFYPVIPHFASQLIGPAEDNMANLWGVWWTHQAFHARLDYLHPTCIFYPEGASVLFSLSPYITSVAFVAGVLLPSVVVYNLLVLSTFVFAGIGAFLLIRYITDDTAAALLGGFVFAFSPSHLAHSLHHVTIATVQFIPFFVLFYLRTMEHASRKNVLWASVFLLLNTLVCWDYLVYALFFMVAYYCITACRNKRLLMPGPIVSSLIIVGATLVFLSPLIIPMLASASRHPNVWASGHDAFTIDVLGFILPHYLHWSAGIPSIAQANGSYVGGIAWESVGYLGVFCVGLVLASTRTLVKRAARYVLGLLFFLVLALGTSLHLLGRTIPGILPYAVIQYIPVLSGARAPGRVMAYAYLFLAVLVAIAFSYQLREGFLSKRKWVAALLVLGICADFWTPCPKTTPVRLPPAYTAILKQEPAPDFGVLDLPSLPWFRRARYMMYQTMHEIPLVQGYLARKPSPTLVDSLVFDSLPAQRAQLRSAHVKYIVMHKRYLMRNADESGERDLNRYREEYGAFFEDEENLVLRVY